MPHPPGSRIGPYEIVAPLGAGSMGEVFKARDPRLDRTVAIKVSKQQFTERFEREARAVASLNHPNVCTLYDVGPDYLVMEWQISTAGGDEPYWRRDGKELYYISQTDLMAVDVQEKGGAVVAGLPHTLFKVPNIQQRRNRLVAMPDGQKFLVVTPVEEEGGTRINIVVNWPGLLAGR